MTALTGRTGTDSGGVPRLLPQVARDRMYEKLVPDQVRRTDRAARAAYESRTVL